MSYNSNDMMAKINSLSLGEKLVAGGGIVMLIASILPWIKISVKGAAGFAGASASKSAWGAPASIWSILAVLIAIILAGIVIARIMNMNLPALPSNLTWGQVFGGGAALVVVLMILKAWRITAVQTGGVIDKSFGFGFFIAVLATIAIAYGGFLLYSEDKGSGFSIGGGGGGFRR
jgi:uncharacterized membrane protein